MKSETVVKSLAELSPKMVEAQTAKLAKADAKPLTAAVHQPRQAQLPVRAPDRTEFTGYPHWGLNE